MVPHPPATLPPAQRRRHLVTAHREPKDENTCLKELNRNQKALLAVYRKEILDLKAQILGLQQTVCELREHNVNLQDDALEALIPELLFTAPQPPPTQHPVHRRQPRATACAPGEPCVRLPHPPSLRPQRRRPRPLKKQPPRLLRREQMKQNRLQ
jgi:hypothetical protein